MEDKNKKWYNINKKYKSFCSKEKCHPHGTIIRGFSSIIIKHWFKKEYDISQIVKENIIQFPSSNEKMILWFVLFDVLNKRQGMVQNVWLDHFLICSKTNGNIFAILEKNKQTIIPQRTNDKTEVAINGELVTCGYYGNFFNVHVKINANKC